MPQSVVIVLLSYSGRPCLQVTTMILQLITELGRRGIDVHYQPRAGDSMIARARNAAVSDFLADPTATDLLFIDDDNFCDAADLVQLVTAPADVVGAPIRVKQDAIKWNVGWCNDRPLWCDEFGLVEVEHVGTGLMRIRRRALERMIAADPEAWYADASAQSGRSHNLFANTLRDHVLYGEDVSFCHRWRALGGKVQVDPDIATHHIGIADFTGKAMGWLASLPRQVEIISGDVSAFVDNRIGVAAEISGTVSLCIASRGRPGMLAQTAAASDAAATLDATRVVIGVDRDQVPDVITARLLLAAGPRFVASIADREDSLGAKYNRIQGAHAADLYVCGCDDTIIPTPGWDAKLLRAAAGFKDGIGIVYFGHVPGAFQPGIAVTHKLATLMGGMFNPHFPFWWHDTWLDEIGRMIGRIAHADVDVIQHGPIGETRGLRDVAFWAEFFDSTRTLRVRKALDIIGQLDETRAFKDQLVGRINPLCEAFRERNALLRDPDKARAFEASNSIDAPADARYERAKASAEQLLVDIGAWCAAA